MNNTTNAAKRPSGLRACADGLDTNPDKYFAQKCMRHAADRMEELESELAAVTEQLKAAQDGWHDEITKGLSELRRAESLYTQAQERAERAEEQRDEYKAALQSADNHNHEIGTKLEIVTEQRDSIDSMYHKVIKEVLECDPIPACQREDDQLESPWEVIARVREQRDRLAEALEQWQPIETAPKDRSFILSAHPEHGYLITRWLGAREMWDGWAIEPTHWMSLPNQPTP